MMEEKIQRLLSEGESHTFRNNSETKDHGTYGRVGVDFRAWVAEVEDFIVSTYGTDSAPWRVFERFNINGIGGNYQDAFDEQKGIVISALKSCLRIQPRRNDGDLNKGIALANIFSKFHSVVRQLRSRHNGRSTLDVEDEYDVQDLLHALLRLHCDDIRDEEWAPSYAGGASRMDFLLKEEKIVVEVKKTRKGLTDKELGKQLIEDMEKYRAHPDCLKLICFVYDPEGYITNPKGIQNDLNRRNNDFEVVVVIEP